LVVVDGDRPNGVEEAQANYDLSVALHGEEDPAAILALRQLARTHRDAGENWVAEVLLTRCLTMQRRMAHSDPRPVLRTEFDLANVLLRLGELRASIPNWEHILEVGDQLEFPDHALSMGASLNLAGTLRELKRYADEFPLRARILAERRESVGNEHVDTYRSLVDLAQVQSNLGNHQMALDLYGEALAGFQRIGADHRVLLQQQWAIASELATLNRPKEASEMFDQVLEGSTRYLEPDDPLRRSALKQRRVYSLLGRFGGRKRRTSHGSPINFKDGPPGGNAADTGPVNGLEQA
jgi:tetratricopeptide (TPR) repeat protein